MFAEIRAGIGLVEEKNCHILCFSGRDDGNVAARATRRQPTLRQLPVPSQERFGRGPAADESRRSATCRIFVDTISTKRRLGRRRRRDDRRFRRHLKTSENVFLTVPQTCLL